MAISVSSAVNNILSDKYNKTNVICYFALIITAMIFYVCSMTIYEKEILAGIIGFIIYLTGCIFASGIIAIAINNGYNNLPSVFPNVVERFKESFICGLKFYAGFTLLSIIFSFIFMILLIPVTILFGTIYVFANNNVVNGILIIIGMFIFFAMVLYMILLELGVLFNFYKSLEIEDLINLKKGWNYIRYVRKPLSSYILRIIGIGLLSAILFITLLFIVLFLISIPAIFNNIQFNDIQYAVIFIIMGSFIFPVSSLICLDLAIQFLKEADKILPEEIKNEPEEEIDEYIEDV